jgi:hypothetical protein
LPVKERRFFKKYTFLTLEVLGEIKFFVSVLSEAESGGAVMPKNA